MGFEPFLAYEASAGSGKTFNLVVRYLSLLFMGEDPKSITALTFTNKAANEMMERVTQTLQYLQERGELAQISQVSGLTEEEILGRRDEVLKRFLRSEVQISTIDAFFGMILRKFALNSGIMPTYKTTQNHHEVKLMERFLHEIEVSHQSDALVRLSLLSDKRLSDLFGLLEGLYGKHKEFESLTFSDIPEGENGYARAMELANELSALVVSKPISERGRKTMQIESYDALLDKTWLLKPSMEYWDFKKIYEPRMDELLHEIQEAVVAHMRYKESHYFKELFSILKLYIKSRQTLIIQNNELSFDDITLMVHTLLREKLESEFLYFRLDSRMKHLLLDEFQDTSTVQFDILRPLIEEIRAGIGVNEGGSFFFVGDVKQSIYRFRGGVSALFYQVADYFGVHVEPLRVNYRSRKEIVTFVNSVFGEKIRGYVHQESPASLAGGYVWVHICTEPLEVLGEHIDYLIKKGAVSEGIAILTATNKDGSAVEAYLGNLGYEVVTETTAKLIHQRSVRAIIEYLRYCYFGAPLYRHNCAALLGVETKQIGRTVIEDVIRECVRFIERWEIADKSALMFLEELRGYRDIEETVFECERLEASSPQSDLKGIRIMTVHKSKGLEFEHVIVLDRLGQPRSRSEPILYEHEASHLRALHYRIKGREYLDPSYAQALEKEKKLQHEDQLNALYVALTRAVHSLCVITKEKGSLFAPLELKAEEYGELIPMSKRSEPVNEVNFIDYQPHSYGRQDDVITAPKEETHDYAAVQFGLALHYTLEMMGTFDKDSLKNALESTRNRYGATLESGAISRIEERVGRLIDDPQFCDLTSGECRKEQMIRHEGALGVIDLLIRHEDSWVIIDYKSGHEEEEKHQDQVRRYMRAVRTFGANTVRGYLCYLLEEEIVWIECL
ncbi:MAG: RecB-like helicase [Sulfuricurvum sp.]|uniref:RecB-like helicase n=1 Tax=Sulfuricurvum sp. TaxID=2025608 RepID=UPI0025D42D72|nr:RecB-like helicase [Sulfuricurvum sp.]MCK9374032.1 RecB-like helicase [Sulfuricurvum sp.]